MGVVVTIVVVYGDMVKIVDVGDVIEVDGESIIMGVAVVVSALCVVTLVFIITGSHNKRRLAGHHPRSRIVFYLIQP